MSSRPDIASPPGLSLPRRLAERIRLTRDAPPAAAGEFVLYWMHNALRATENPALDAALTAAQKLGLPAFVYHAISERYPFASDRHHTFMLEGARDVSAALAERGVGYAFHLERPDHRGPHLKTLAERAAVVVTEEMPVEPITSFLTGLTDHLDAVAPGSGPPIWSVDTSCVVPMPLVDQRPDRAFQFKKATAKLRKQRLTEVWQDVPTPRERGADGPFLPDDLPFEPIELASADLPAMVAECAIDHTVFPIAGHTPGGLVAGERRWAAYRENGLKQYAATRNDAAREGSASRMSPYLHYGMVSPFRTAREAKDLGGKGPEKFLDELLTWRELAYHFCFHTPDPDSLDAIPDWARETLEAHASDERPALYDWETLARGTTGTAFWDLCQRSLLRQGELHNNVRMTWGKALLDWTPGPRRCLELLLDLNHRFALDGRDPSSYGGLLWVLGQFDRPFPPSKPISGVVRDRSVKRHAARLDMDRYEKLVSRPPIEPAPTVAVIGAGIAGLVAARTLSDAGWQVTVFDKGRGVGGRASSRREGEGDSLSFDHGAQYFTIKDDRFGRFVQAWIERGVIAPWTGRLAAVENGDYQVKETPELLMGKPTMGALPRHLAADLDVRSARRVAELNYGEGGWRLAFESGADEGPFDRVLVTAPAPQTAELLDGHTPLTDVIRTAEYHACWAALLAFDTAPALPFDGAFLNDSRLPDGRPNPLAWASREASKPGRPGAPERWVLHAKADWSDEHVDRSPAEILPKLVAAFAALVEHAVGKPLPTPSHQTAHRWRFAQIKTAASAGQGDECFYDAATGLGAAGDWCLGGRIEGAFLSGAALAGRVAGDLAATRHAATREDGATASS
ncbi:FAD-dependent oxidoreductase [Alienimonas chondri]|uniref:tRNA 5-methylaminomethyl-2-thiouridine biosynthesis bifunctional protein MnmC n=1 Tax=Alienimonas chondri TaxID=2681879 RepID=A0ABX1VGQ9_9PLAN|nr:FAD-dependent oxidoreductase [Alienimonas chondri]NNJ26468.1 tRNA 5-methylaminomethyl-2-thiouridine biosynthesis bifunctional protein MnmC [Alienimonas chondri]